MALLGTVLSPVDAENVMLQLGSMPADVEHRQPLPWHSSAFPTSDQSATTSAEVSTSTTLTSNGPRHRLARFATGSHRRLPNTTRPAGRPDHPRMVTVGRFIEVRLAVVGRRCEPDIRNRPQALNDVERLIVHRARGFRSAEAALTLVMLSGDPTLQLPTNTPPTDNDPHSCRESHSFFTIHVVYIIRVSDDVTYGVLAVPSRRRLLEALRGANDPLDLVALATASGLHPNTVRFHLDVLARAGLVQERRQRRATRGRP